MTARHSDFEAADRPEFDSGSYTVLVHTELAGSFGQRCSSLELNSVHCLRLQLQPDCLPTNHRTDHSGRQCRPIYREDALRDGTLAMVIPTPTLESDRKSANCHSREWVGMFRIL